MRWVGRKEKWKGEPRRQRGDRSSPTMTITLGTVGSKVNVQCSRGARKQPEVPIMPCRPINAFRAGSTRIIGNFVRIQGMSFLEFILDSHENLRGRSPSSSRATAFLWCYLLSSRDGLPARVDFPRHLVGSLRPQPGHCSFVAGGKIAS